MVATHTTGGVIAGVSGPSVVAKTCAVEANTVSRTFMAENSGGAFGEGAVAHVE